jgi:hypothetical protein
VITADAMGIFSRFFKGGPEGEQPGGEGETEPTAATPADTQTRAKETTVNADDPARPRAPVVPKLPKTRAPTPDPTVVVDPPSNPVKVAPTKASKNDPTMVLSPPPAPRTSTPAPQRNTPPPQAAQPPPEPVVKFTTKAPPIAKNEPAPRAATAPAAPAAPAPAAPAPAAAAPAPEPRRPMNAEAIPVLQPTTPGSGPIPPAPIPRWSGSGRTSSNNINGTSTKTATPTPVNGVSVATSAPSTTTSAPSTTTSAPSTATTSTSSGARRAKNDSIADAFDLVTKPQAPTNGTAVKHGISTAEDLAAVRGVFNEVAVVHVTQVRDVMLELRYGDADPAWMESTRPALHSLRAMAAQMDLTDLVKALDEFCSAVESSVANRATITEADKTELLRRYQRLIELIPQAFELDAERDRREPIIIESLLLQIDGVERRTIDKLFAVGLNRLDALTHAKSDEVEIVAGIRREIADKIVAQFASYKKASNAAVSSRDPAAERRELADLLIMMSLQNDDFERVANLWTEEAKNKKRELRKAREQTFQRIKVSLARLGEKDQLARLEKQPFNERIQTLDRFLSAPRATS